MNAAAKRPSRSPQPLTVQDFQKRLPLVRAIVTDITRLHADLTERRERLKAVRRLPGGKRREDTPYSEELAQVDREIDSEERTLRTFVAELEGLGGELIDPRAGRVEFSGRLEGRGVLFGWVYGDEDLSYWRETDSDESERHSLLEGSVARDEDD